MQSVVETGPRLGYTVWIVYDDWIIGYSCGNGCGHGDPVIAATFDASTFDSSAFDYHAVIRQ
jgi:hypothetical protein